MSSATPVRPPTNAPNEPDHFIPVRLEDIVTGLVAQAQKSGSDDKIVRQFCKIYIALFHARFHAKRQALKHCYLPFSPDRETVNVEPISAETLDNRQTQLLGSVRDILEKANYCPVSHDELNQVLTETSPYGLKVEVDFSEFDELEVYYRGTDIERKTERRWYTLWLVAHPIEIPIYRRLFVLIKLSPKKRRPRESAATWRGVKQRLLEYWERLFEFRAADAGDGSSCIYLKLFKDIPKSDLEMLFPNTRVKMAVLDKMTLAVSGGGGIVSGLLALATKIARAANPYAIALTLAGFGGIVWREIAKVFSNRNRYMANLAKSLYFHNLDNNLGVLNNLMEMAEEEECKESLLAFYFLSSRGRAGCTRQQLDRDVERHLRECYGVTVDFDLADGLDKLLQAQLAQTLPSGLLGAIDTTEAVVSLDREWDNLFVPAV